MSSTRFPLPRQNLLFTAALVVSNDEACYNDASEICNLLALSAAMSHMACAPSVWYPLQHPKNKNKETNLNGFEPLGFNVITANSLLHIVENDWPWTTIDKDATLCQT